jgi:hypothetical protein
VELSAGPAPPPALLAQGPLDGAGRPRRTVDGTVAVAVDHVLHVNPFVLKPGAYTPGRRTQYGQEVSEWQVIVSLAPSAPAPAGPFPASRDAFRRVLEARAASDAQLSVPIAFKPFDAAEVAVFNASLSLACVLGWDDAAPLPVFGALRPSCGSARGAVALAGSPLHGEKSRDMGRVREVAHFCARSLLGPVPFDVVAVPVVSRTSLAEADAACGGAAACLDEYRARNARHLREIAQAVEEELFLLDVPGPLFPRVVLVPMCRLGSHFAGEERDWPCRSSFWSGQYISLFFMYNLVGTSFRWSSSYDLDEVLAPQGVRAGEALRETRAAVLFDSLNGRGANAMKFIWLNFRVAGRGGHYEHSTRPLTRSLLKLRTPALMDRETGGQEDCYRWPSGQSLNGKTALRCDDGVGFTIHAAVQLRPESLLNGTTRVMTNVVRSVRLWHPRLNGSLGQCDLVPMRV